MNQYFIESKSKQPIFYSFDRIFKNLETNIDYNLIIREFQENFEIEQQQNWTKFWNKQGENIILDTWNIKYKDFLKETQEVDNQKEKALNEDNKLEEPTSSKKILKNSEATLNEKPKEDSTFDEKSWQDLWHNHREEIYLEQYLLFTTIYYNYFLDLKKSCETPETIAEDIEAESLDLQTDNLQLTEELDQLKILGLPTSFGGRPQHSSKKHKTINKSIHYSDFYSDSEMENESNDSDVEENSFNELSSTITKEFDNPLHNIQQKSITKLAKKKRNRKLKNVPDFILEEKGLLKYWRKRFSLFSRFDEGIRLDRESWFSVTPEKVAKHLAQRLKCQIIVDGFCGSGGNAIQFALTCEKVIAIDIDPVKLEMAKHNAEIYKVSHKIEFILGDFLQLSSGGHLKADIIFLSPPWGGPKYKNKKEFDIEKYLLPVNASELVATSRNVSENIVLFLPRNSNVKQIVKLAGVGKRCEIEHNYLDSRLVAITALYGEEILKTESNK